MHMMAPPMTSIVIHMNDHCVMPSIDAMSPIKLTALTPPRAMEQKMSSTPISGLRFGDARRLA